MIDWQFFPQTAPCPDHLTELVTSLEVAHPMINSEEWEGQTSDEVLEKVRPAMESLGYKVETSKKKVDKIRVPVFFGRNGKSSRAFEADALSLEHRTVLEVEAGRAVTNYQFLKDLFQASVMQDVDYLVIAVRKIYRGNRDFETVCSFIEILYASDRLNLPLRGILIVGY
jgi:hypothetical protein